jgi:glycosyltransferase involved in cell wall biosynthesis
VVSVIIPTYNSDKYIGEALDSVLCQTYADYEIIVIDDGSTDDTKKIIEEHYPLVRYYFVENRGVSSARNLGISLAQGEFIAFLDADDRWLPDKLEKQTALFQSDDNLGMVFTENYFFDEHGIKKNKLNKRKRLMYGDIVRNIFLNSYVATPTVMVRKSVFDAVGFFEEGLTVAEDDNMWMRIAMRYGVELLDEPLVLCRVTEGSLSRTNRNIFLGVRKHIEIIKNKYPDIYKYLGNSAIRRKYSDLFFSEGYNHFSKHQYKKARINFGKSYFYCPFRIKSLLYLISTVFSPLLIEKLRKRKTNML